MANKSRQESAVVTAISKAYAANGRQPFSVRAGKTEIPGVIRAKKYSGRQASGSEPYTDIVVAIKNQKSINWSLKGEDAPSLAGGGMRGLNSIVPGIADKFLKIAHKNLLMEGYQEGDVIPDVYAKIPTRAKELIVIGNRIIGGPIDYMYVGPMSVQSDYDSRKNVLSLNGSLIDSKTYAKTQNLYFRLRARMADQRFEPDAMKNGVPRIYSKSKNGEAMGRIVVTNFFTKTGILVNL